MWCNPQEWRHLTLRKLLDRKKHSTYTEVSLTQDQLMIVPYLTYCVDVWGSAGKTYTHSVFILQKRAIRIISRSRYRVYSILQIMHKAHETTLPTNIQKDLKKEEAIIT